MKSPRHFFPFDFFGWDYIDDTSGKLLNHTLVEKARDEEISVIQELGVWEVVDKPRDEVVRAGLTSSKETRPNRSTADEWSSKNTNVKQTGHFSTAVPPLEALQRFFDL